MGKELFRIKSPVVITLLIFLLICVPFYFSLISSTTHARQGCERLNASRQVQYQYLVGDLAQRHQVVDQDRTNLTLLQSKHPIQAVHKAYGIRLNETTLQTSIAQAQQRIASNQGFIDNDQTSIKALRLSTAQYATDVPVVINCHEAYPQPFPINFLDE